MITLISRLFSSGLLIRQLANRRFSGFSFDCNFSIASSISLSASLKTNPEGSVRLNMLLRIECIFKFDHSFPLGRFEVSIERKAELHSKFWPQWPSYRIRNACLADNWKISLLTSTNLSAHLILSPRAPKRFSKTVFPADSRLHLF